MNCRSSLLFFSALLLGFASSRLAAAEAKPVVLYSRYFNAIGETRYQPDGSYQDVLERLRPMYEVRVSDAPLNPETLKGVALVLIANPSDQAVGQNPPPHHCTPEDVAQITRYVEAGGGLIALGNQEKHNLETHDFNALLGAFGMAFEDKYTDVKPLRIPPATPLLGGLRWAYYTGNHLALQTSGPAKTHALITNDLTQKPLQGTRDEPGALLATAERGQGRVVVATDAGWISHDALSGQGIGGVSIKEQDNWEIFSRLVSWAATRHSVWQGYSRLDFQVDGRNCLLVSPTIAAPGHPWIWRTEFFGHEPQGDVALLGHGFHVAYMDVQNMYGAPVALDHMDRFYEHLTREFGLSAKPVLEGFSRGGLFAFNWAARHPQQVGAIYADAPVCDFRTWPRQGAGADWTRLKAVYGFASDEEALASKANPVDNLAPLAAAKVPLLHVCGDADKVVPLEHNTLVVQQRYQQLGGEIKVILKPGVDHHPHSLPDPSPIVDWVLAHTPGLAQP